MGLGSDSKNTKLISLKDLLTDSYSLAGSINDTESKAASTLVNIKDAIFKTSDELKHEQVMDRIRLGFKTNRELHEFFKNYLKLDIPHKKNCFENHQTPMDFVGDALLNREYHQFVVGSRGSGKSYLAGLIMWMLGNRHTLFEGKILGGSADQSMKSYEAMQDFWDKAGKDSKSVLVDEYTRKTFTRWKTGSIVSILTASSKSARGSHPQCLCLDEQTKILTIEGEICIKDLKVGQTIFSYDYKGNIVNTTVKKIFNQGKKPMIKLNLSNGRFLKLTPDHKIYTEKGWLESHAIKKEKVFGVSHNDRFRFKNRTMPSLLENYCKKERNSLCRLWENIIHCWSIPLLGMCIKKTQKSCRSLLRLWKTVKTEKYYSMQKMLGRGTLQSRNDSENGRRKSDSNEKYKNAFSCRNAVSRIIKYFKSKMGGTGSNKQMDNRLCTSRTENSCRSTRKLLARQKRRNNKGCLEKIVFGATGLQGFIFKNRKNPPVVFDVKRDISILSVEYCGEGNVYDIQVSSFQNFIASGIIVHNCLDELDEMDFNIYSAVVQQPMAKNGIPSRLIALSTYHRLSGTVARLMGDVSVATNEEDADDEQKLARNFKQLMKIYKICYDKETEVLTNSGWKLFKDVLDTDLIFSLNPETNTPEYSKFINRTAYNYKGDMIHFKGKTEDVLVTPNHKMYASLNSKRNFKLISAEELSTKKFFQFNKFSEWVGSSPDTFTIDSFIIDFPLFCEFMGYYLSEGCLRKPNGLKIGQSRKVHTEAYDKIKNCLKKVFPDKKICEYPNGPEVYGIKSVNLYLSQFGKSYDKFVPEIIKLAKKEHIQIFMDAYFLGDGGSSSQGCSYYENKEAIKSIKTYYTSSDKMSSDIGELIIKIGKFPSYTKVLPKGKLKHTYWHIRETNSKSRCFSYDRTDKGSMKVTRVPYDDMVYCLQLEKNHVMLIRRFNRCSWQGNCIWEVLEPCKDYICSTCPLTSYCPGVHMKDAVGYYKISDFVQKIQSLSRYSLEAEWFCRRPDRKGLVLADYRDSVNTLDIGYIEGLPVYVSIDFGFTHNSPYVVGFFHEVENFKLHDGRIITGTIMFNEIYRVPKTNKDIIEEVKALPYCSNPSKIIGVADSAEQDLIREWKQNGFRINSVSKKSGSILSGLDKLVGKISPAQGSPSFYVSKKCRGFLKEKDNYKWGNKGEPLDEDNHCFIAGTLVLTDKGEIPIERIKVGDKVLTRTGFQKILWAGSTGIKEVYRYRINGKDLICTDTHPIYTENRGFIPIKHLAQLDIICMSEKTFQLINTDSLLYVQEHVAHREGKQEVYNLQVENSPEFFANSILVHNSIDMTRYYLTSLKSRSWAGKGISIV